MKLRRFALSALAGVALSKAAHAESLTGLSSRTSLNRSQILVTSTGQKLRITPYGPWMTRIQAVADGQMFWGDDRYEVVQSHNWPGHFVITDEGTRLVLKPESGEGMALSIDKQPLRITVLRDGEPLLNNDAALGLDTGERPLELRVDGQLQSTLAFAPTNSWTEWQTLTAQVNLSAGEHTIELRTTGAGGPNLDYLDLSRTATVRYEAEAATLSGPVASAEHRGFSGAGYADFQTARGETVQFHVSASEAGDYDLQLRYANGAPISAHFASTIGEHFTGLGHGAFGRVAHLDLAGQRVARNRETQAALTVPFFLSSRGYGVFVNNTYANNFAFLNDDYGVTLAGGQLDYFVIEGPTLPDVLDHYTALTGRPMLPPVDVFGFGLSDKLKVDLPSDATWWQDKVNRMHGEGYPFNMIIHDNSWRNGKSAPWEWDLHRYPDPAAFETWCVQNGISNMLDFNRDNGKLSDGWRDDFALPGTADFPDFTSQEVRDWFFRLLWTKTLDPALGYPGDFLWLDEFDEQVTPPTPDTTLANGRRWDETSNYYLFLVAKTVGEGWSRGFGDEKRPYFMARGMSAGAQRWSSLWSGDIDTNYAEMGMQVRGMLAAGLSGFPYWAHDAGGFQQQPDSDMYKRWSMGFGSFSPVWKPHGPGLRFPWQYNTTAQDAAHRFSELRMQLLPYNYTYARLANANGTPMARPLLLEYPTRNEAWQYDQEYLWGHEFLVVPDAARPNRYWLPPGVWYDFFSEEHLDGDRQLTATNGFAAGLGTYVRAGAIVPMTDLTLTPRQWDKTALTLHVYTGADGTFELLDDDGESQRLHNGSSMATAIRYDDTVRRLVIEPARGTFEGAPTERKLAVVMHGITTAPQTILLQGQALPASAYQFDATHHLLKIALGSYAVDAPITVEASREK